MNRVNKLLDNIKKYNTDGVLIFKPENRKYFSGFTGTTGYIIITEEERIFATDFRYMEQAKEQCKGYTIKEVDQKYTIYHLLKELKIENLAVEDDFITYEFVLNLENNVKGLKLIPLKGLLTKIRMIKDDEEVELISKAAKITDDAFTHILNFVRPGVKEIEISNELEAYMKKQGATGASFSFIVASGLRSSMPHGVASEKVIEQGDFVTIDMGCIYKGYCSDMTRTIVVGKATEEQKKIYNIVLKAQEEVLKAIKPGITGYELDSIARDIITKEGYGDNFGHGLGHGVGLEVHELPRLANNDKSKTPMESGMVITDEPGIYISGFGGVRIEDLILVTEDGYKVLSNSTKDLLEINI
ncbi:aminopeptidase P family protein [Clostridium sp. D2Q-11]|uniref:Aminopeptidase P family protein n=1 Tax=Anaeromonas frigoriresistens TaxID=2683708 RepID=A0A942UVH3_9FIRM|nr:Xaa-Pro peptidase family protein [Anaeromonas frigoriresistens]MBS4539999.1 aminopeptidase P family protein [Anaeromonas frigoriresistens]